jgi:cobyrinic acid a,c-diamide synthase
VKHGLVVGAVATGEGKTLVGLAIAALLARRGVPVVPFKIGPDYIDARLYESACGKPARNVDLWLDGPANVRAHVESASRGSFALLEGMMGLFDGDNSGETSTAHVAALLDVPVLLVIDLWRMSQSAAAVALGCAQMAPSIRIAGVVLNRAGGAEHEKAVRKAFEATGIPIVAALPHRAHWRIPERHLGLDRDRAASAREIAAEVADVLEAQIDRAFFAELPEAPQNPERAAAGKTTIALAGDPALWFTYPETIDALERAGARVVPFSPLRDSDLPPDTRGLWLGGGYPETYAAELAQNEPMRRSVASAVSSGLPVYAECGGLMYLAEELETPDGVFQMCGALRGRTSMAQPRLRIGYRRARMLHDSVCGSGGDEVRAYEFHYADETLSEEAAYAVDGDRAGAWRPRVLASFLHRHFLPGDAAIERFVGECA